MEMAFSIKGIVAMLHTWVFFSKLLVLAVLKHFLTWMDSTKVKSRTFFTSNSDTMENIKL